MFQHCAGDRLGTVVVNEEKLAADARNSEVVRGE